MSNDDSLDYRVVLNTRKKYMYVGCILEVEPPRLDDGLDVRGKEESRMI